MRSGKKFWGLVSCFKTWRFVSSFLNAMAIPLRRLPLVSGMPPSLWRIIAPEFFSSIRKI